MTNSIRREMSLFENGGVSALAACLDPEGRKLFLALARVIKDVSWSGQNIRVYNEVTITPPYKVENVTGDPESQSYSYIRKFVEHHWRDNVSTHHH
ncbi:Protein LSM12 homolog [Eumeta japonica]|uniref:Protein LSM12 homolog n=1 Tax=Eumeta variegata TaxID=151549 RepID=A0A4C2A9T8_EUMVA|nr:Protein LSM12 homolog [Eumeta japonica]